MQKTPPASSRHYRERAAHLRQVARDAVTEGLRTSCLKAAEACEQLAAQAAREEAKTKSITGDKD